MTKSRIALAVATTGGLLASLLAAGAAPANAAGAEKAWNDTYYLQQYKCAPLVGLSFRGSGEDRSSDHLSDATQLETIKHIDFPASVMRQVNPWYDFDSDPAHGNPAAVQDPVTGQYNEDENANRKVDDITTNGWEGETVDKLIQGWASARYMPTATDPFPIIGIGANTAGAGYGYEAPAVQNVNNVEILKGAIVGGKAGARYIQTVKDYYASQGCSVVPRFIVMGYSQGAVAARVTAIEAPDDVLAAYTIGDAELNSAERNHQGKISLWGDGSSTGTGILRATLGNNPSDAKFEHDPTTIDMDAYDKVQSRNTICHKHDPVCDFEWLVTIWKGVFAVDAQNAHHIDYFKNPSDEGTDDYYEQASVGSAMAFDTTCIQRTVLNGTSCWTGEDGDTPIFVLKGAQRKLAAAQAADQKAFAAEVLAAVKKKPSVRVSTSKAGKSTTFTVPKAKRAVYSYDFDGNGRYELKSKKSTAVHTYKKAGTTHAHVLVKWGKHKKVYKVTVKTKAAPKPVKPVTSTGPGTTTGIDSPNAPAGIAADSIVGHWYSSSYQLKNSSVTVDGRDATIKVAGLPAGSEYGVRFVKTTGDPFKVEASQVVGPFTSNAAGADTQYEFLDELSVGTYQALIVTPTGYHAAYTVKVS